ncbi:nacht domain-containing protein, partial [Fusarium flagelliforme]
MQNVSSAVGFTARLKPEIRLAQAISEFSTCLQNKNQRARFKNLHSQSPPSPDDIIRLTEEINRDGARSHRLWRPYGTRLVAILERMRQFAPIGDVLVGGSQNLIACGVWAAVRLSLETSLSFLSYFENVTNMMLRLGRSLSLHKDFATLFPKCPTLQSYICEYTIVMVNICAKIVHDCAKSALSQLAASLTSTFDAAFKPLESDLATWALLIEKSTAVLLAKAELQSHSSVLDRFNRLQITMSTDTAKRQRESRKHRLLAALCPEQSEFDQIWRRERKRGTSSWMYEQDAYKTWLSSKAGSVLWLNGNLGSGKTVTMASAVAQLTLDAPSMDPQGGVTVSYFFCQSSNPKTLSATNLLGSIVGQVLQSPAIEPSFMSSLEQPETMSFSQATPEACIDILIKVTPSNWRGIFVLDGLDEISDEAVDDVFRQLHRLEEHRRSRFDGVRTLSMETADRSKEISAYLAAEVSRWNAIRPLPTELERLMEEQLLVGCQGMFLWLSLQIEDICPRYTQELRSDAEILDILGNLPKDLPGAFDKALSRMVDGKQGSKVFKLVASADPPMNMDELRVASNVEPGNTVWNYSTLIGTGKALISAYGGSLLDIDEEDLRVRFIHYSVLLHLTARSSDEKTGIFHFDLPEAEQMLSAVCVTYLSYAVFENRISKSQKASFAQVPQVTATSVMPSEAFRKGINLLTKHRRQRDAKVDLERLSYELQNQRRRVSDDVHLFLDYAKDHWLLSTRDIWSDDRYRVLPLWRNLITSPIVSDSLPWVSVVQAATWALINNHATLFQHYLHSKDQDSLHAALRTAVDAVRTKFSQIRLRKEGLGWLGPFYLVFPESLPTILASFTDLGCIPFNPALAECPFPSICGPSLMSSATRHLIASLEASSERVVGQSYFLFLMNYLHPQVLLENGSKILHVAISHRYIDLAHELLSKGVEPSGPNLQLCIERKLMSLAGQLVEAGAEVTFNNFQEESPLLFLAIEESNWEFFFALLRRGVFQCDGRYGVKLDTACHRLCRGRPGPKSQFSEAALEALIHYGADIRLKNSAGETPLLLAVRTNQRRLTEILLQHGADPRVGNQLGAQPLHIARDTVIIQHLLRQKADLEAAAGGHVTPLMVAAYQGRAEAVGALLDNGADPNRPIGDVNPNQVLLLRWRDTRMPCFWATAFDLCLARLEQELEERPGASRRGQLLSELVSVAAQFLRRGTSLEIHDCGALIGLMDSLS